MSLTCLTAVTAFGQSNFDLRERLAAIQKNAPTKKDFKVQVTQSFYSNLRQRTKTTTGSLIFSPPKKFNWQLGDESFVYNGSDFWKYNARAKHAAKLGNDNLAALAFLDAIIDPAAFAKQFDVTSWSLVSVVGDELALPPDGCLNSTFLCLRLSPKSPTDIKVLLTALNASQGWVEELRIVYQDGNKAVLKFSSYELMKSSSGAFDFKPPAGTAVDQY